MTTITSGLLAVIALIGAWITLQQMGIARTRLNHDLFDRRFAVYRATRNYIKIMLQNKGGTQEDAVSWFEIACAAPFLFEKEIADFVNEVSERGSKIRGRVGDKYIYEVKEHVAEYNEHYMWFMKVFDSLEDRF